MDKHVEKSILNNRFQIKQIIGQGSFGNVHRALDRKKRVDIAVKIANRRPGSKQHDNEIMALRAMNKVKGFPRFYGSQISRIYVYLFIELLGLNLQQVYCMHKKELELDVIVNISIQMVKRLRSLHKRNIIHRDLKPQQFLLGKKEPRLLYLVDFGLSKLFTTSTGQHQNYMEGRKFIGTPYYASLNTHIGLSQSRRDDLQSLCYIFSFLINGSLPWATFQTKDSLPGISMLKNKTTPKMLFQNSPQEFLQIFQYVKSLQFNQNPNYKYIINSLKKVQKSYCLNSRFN